jgi:hypothetical protein
MTRGLARLLGAPPGELHHLAGVLALEGKRRRDFASKDGGMTERAITFLAGFYLTLLGGAIGFFTYQLHATPGIAVPLLLAFLLFPIAALAASELFTALLGDEGFRPLASWPVSSASWLGARLLGPLRHAVGATLLLAVPSAIVLAVTRPLPVVDGVVFLAAALGQGVALVLTIAGGYALLLPRLGARRLRRFATLAGVAGLLMPMIGGALLGKRWALLPVLPAWTSAAWLAALAAITVVIVRAGARRYATGLATALVHPRGSSWRWVARLALGARRPADRVLGLLVVAHLREDWRFRAQALLVPALVGVTLVSGAAGVPLFADPFVHPPGVWFHPAMAFVVAALLPPLLAVPLIARSAEAGSAWIVRAGVVPETELVLAVRRFLRRTVVAPFTLAVAACYLVAGTAPLSVLGHAVVLALLAEVALLATHRALAVAPFSRPADDGDVQRAAVASVMLAYVLSGIVSAAVVHVGYRYWPAYALLVAWLVLTRQALTRTSSAPAARGGAARAP